MIIPKEHTRLEVWAPRYSDKHTKKEYVVMLAKYKVDAAAPTLLIEFTKAKHLLDKKFVIEKVKAQRYQVEPNGTIDCYCVPFSALKHGENQMEYNGRIMTEHAEIRNTLKQMEWI